MVPTELIVLLGSLVFTDLNVKSLLGEREISTVLDLLTLFMRTGSFLVKVSLLLLQYWLRRLLFWNRNANN